MTPLQATEQVIAALSRNTTLIYVSDRFEANELADALLKSEFPVCFHLPIIIVDVPGKSGILKSQYELQAIFLDQQPEETTAFKASDIETRYIAPMRSLAREFVHKLNEHSIIDPETAGIQARTYSPEYAVADAHLFGVLVRAQVPIMEGVTGCVHT